MTLTEAYNTPVALDLLKRLSDTLWWRAFEEEGDAQATGADTLRVHDRFELVIAPNAGSPALEECVFLYWVKEGKRAHLEVRANNNLVAVADLLALMVECERDMRAYRTKREARQAARRGG